MSDPIYIDTNVFIDYFDNRTDCLRPLGEFAFQLLKTSIECRFNIIISSLLLDELFYNEYDDKIKTLLPRFDANEKIIRAEITPEDIDKAKRIVRERNTAFNDTLHAVLAHKMNAAYLITRNVKDFVDLQDLVKVALPENV